MQSEAFDDCNYTQQFDETIFNRLKFIQFQYFNYRLFKRRILKMLLIRILLTDKPFHIQPLFKWSFSIEST